MLLFRLSGLLLLRFADRQFLALLFQLPPRITRFEPVGHHPKSLQHVPPPGPAAGRQGERHQRLHPLLQLHVRPPPGHPLAFIPAELAGKAQLPPPGQPQPLRKDAIAQKKLQNEFSPSATNSFFTASTRCPRRNAFISASAAPRFLIGRTKSFSCIQMGGLVGSSENIATAARGFFSAQTRTLQTNSRLRRPSAGTAPVVPLSASLLRAAPPTVPVHG